MLREICLNNHYPPQLIKQWLSLWLTTEATEQTTVIRGHRDFCIVIAIISHPQSKVSFQENIATTALNADLLLNMYRQIHSPAVHLHSELSKLVSDCWDSHNYQQLEEISKRLVKDMILCTRELEVIKNHLIWANLLGILWSQMHLTNKKRKFAINSTEKILHCLHVSFKVCLLNKYFLTFTFLVFSKEIWLL